MWVLLVASFVVRALLAGLVELGNDEVYYYTYAAYPEWSHFDHPPMVGWVIQLFSLNLLLYGGFFIRLGAVVIGTLSTWLMFKIGKELNDSLTGLYAALLFTASIYGFIISGTFIMPDTPQVFFWLLTVWILLKTLRFTEISKVNRWWLLVAGVTIGLAMLSKYHSLFLVGGIFLFALFFNRSWFLKKEFYFALIIPFILFIPVIIWNVENHFISFTFHEGRLGGSKTLIRPDFFLTEVIGQIFYNNPVNFVLIVAAFLALLKGKTFMRREHLWILILVSAPLSLVFLGMSVFSSTLPHWTGPAYLGFMLIAAAYVRTISHRLIPWQMRLSIALPVVAIMIAVSQIHLGWIPLKADFSTQLYGFQQLGEKFRAYAKEEEEKGIMQPHSPIITYRWFPAAHFDYYVARPERRKVFALGPLDRVHKYFWIDQERGPMQKGSTAYFLVYTDDYQHPSDLFGKLWDSISPPDTIQIIRKGTLLRTALVYKMTQLSHDVAFKNIDAYREPTQKQMQANKAYIYANPEELQRLTNQAIRQNRPLDDVTWQEAKWMYERTMY